MKPVGADFALARASAFWPWWLACACLLAAAAFEAERAISLARERALLERQVNAIGTQGTADAAPTSAPEAAAYAADAARFVKLANMDLAGVLASIESARVPGIRVTAIDIRAGDASARLELEVRDTADLLRYLDDINAGMPVDGRWSLARAQTASLTAPGSATLVRQLQPRDR